MNEKTARQIARMKEQTISTGFSGGENPSGLMGNTSLSTM